MWLRSMTSLPSGQKHPLTRANTTPRSVLHCICELEALHPLSEQKDSSRVCGKRRFKKHRNTCFSCFRQAWVKAELERMHLATLSALSSQSLTCLCLGRFMKLSKAEVGCHQMTARAVTQFCGRLLMQHSLLRLHSQTELCQTLLGPQLTGA